MKIVVTGGAGFVGANLVRMLRRTRPGWGVSVIDNLSTGSAANLEDVDGVTLHVASILDDAALDAVFARADAVVHLAARSSLQRAVVDPIACHDVNATGTLKVVDAVRRADVGQLIVASSAEVYGEAGMLPKHEELPTIPVSAYGASKLAAESYALSAGYRYGLPVLVFRLFNVFGPLQRAHREYGAAIPAFVMAASQRRPLPVFGDGRQTRDFTYVDDVCEVVIDALDRRVSSERPLNLGFGTRRTLFDVIDELSAVFDRQLLVTHAAARVDEVRDMSANPTRLRRLFPGIDPVAFSVGLRETTGWLLADLDLSEPRLALL